MHILQYPSFNNDKRDMLTSICLSYFWLAHNLSWQRMWYYLPWLPPPAERHYSFISTLLMKKLSFREVKLLVHVHAASKQQSEPELDLILNLYT